MVKLNKIYTRTGDDGSTGLVDGSRVSKADARMAAIGDVARDAWQVCVGEHAPREAPVDRARGVGPVRRFIFQ